MICPICNGKGLVSMGPHIRGLKKCTACGGLGELNNAPYSYFEIADLGLDENDNPAPAGVKINLPFKQNTSPEQKINALAELFGVDPSRVTIISKEKYDAEYAEDYEDFDEDWEED